MSELATRTEAQPPARQQAVWERWGLPRDKWETLRSMVANNAPDDVMELYLEKCRSVGCDPFERMFYCVGRRDSRTGQTKWTLQASIDLLRSIANSEPNDEYAGQLGPFWTADGEKWVDCWLTKSHPVACKIGILRKSFKEPLWVVGTMDYYKPSIDSQFWSTSKSWFQLAKCVEALALRKAFPKRLHGLYAAEEMEQDQRGQGPSERPEAIDAPFTPQNPVQAVLAARKAEKQGDTPEARALGISAIRALYEKAGEEPPEASVFDGCTVEQLREIFAATKAAQDAPREEEGPESQPSLLDAPTAPPDAQDAVSRPLAPEHDGKPVGKTTQAKLFALLGEAGIKDKDERLTWARAFGGGLSSLTSFAELSQSQGSFLIDRLQEPSRFVPPADYECPACGTFNYNGHANNCPEAP